MPDLRVFVVEDELLHAEHTKMCIEQAGFRVAGESANADEALASILKAKPDVVLMDISLPGKRNGITVSKELKKQSSIPVIFTTSLNDQETMQEAVEAGPVSYLVKPIQTDNLKAAIMLACSSRSVSPKSREDNDILQDDTLFIKSGNRLQKIQVSDILWIESAGDNYCKIVTTGHQLVSRHSVRQMARILPDRDFIQTHRAYIVNCAKIDSIHEKEQVMGIQGTEIPIGRTFKEEFYKQLKRL
jgi:DNA-binding LytR/AlgR family response regulator